MCVSRPMRSGERVEAFQLLQSGFEDRLLWRYKGPNAMTAVDNSTLLQLGECFADRGAADIETLAQFGFRGKQAIITREIASLNSGKDFMHDLLGEGKAFANHQINQLPEMYQDYCEISE